MMLRGIDTGTDACESASQGGLSALNRIPSTSLRDLSPCRRVVFAVWMGPEVGSDSSASLRRRAAAFFQS
jgi:hypothetical protein